MNTTKEIDQRRASISGMKSIRGSQVAIAYCQHPEKCMLRGIRYFLFQGELWNFRLTKNWFGIASDHDPYRCILFDTQGNPVGRPGQLPIPEAALCGMTSDNG
jgi:hypothetical protein